MKPIIPIFFATDDNYLPIFDVALTSLIQNASRDYNYVINVINSGLDKEKCNIIKRLEDENFTINFCDISDEIKTVSAKLKNMYHFSLQTWYCLFIQSLFPQYQAQELPHFAQFQAEACFLKVLLLFQPTVPLNLLLWHFEAGFCPFLLFFPPF